MPMNKYTRLLKNLGQVLFASGATQSIRIPSETISSLVFLFKTSGKATLPQLLNAIKKVKVAIGSSVDFDISGISLYYFNRNFRGGGALYSNLKDDNRTSTYMIMELPFTLIGGIKPNDTLLDMRPRANGSLLQPFVQLETATGTNVSSASTIDIFAKFYQLGSAGRRGARKRMREYAIPVTASSNFNIPIEYGARWNDISFLQMLVETSGTLETDALFTDLKFNVGQAGAGSINIFDLSVAEADPLTALTREFNYDFDFSGLTGIGAIGDSDNIFTYDPLKNNEVGSGRTLSGLIQLSDATSAVITGETNAGVTGTLRCLIETVEISAELRPELCRYRRDCRSE